MKIFCLTCGRCGETNPLRDVAVFKTCFRRNKGVDYPVSLCNGNCNTATTDSDHTLGEENERPDTRDTTVGKQHISG